ncbi:quinoprotein dehydrogenase-associated SoxYZ-like carrier [Loktanella agnita]|uniref:quinoprotein dehydrogenase-associated SoxYZ-like carrier n=1 Tax=Loktanella agnita TaxID=287097 RepID=UPI003985C153
MLKQFLIAPLLALAATGAVAQDNPLTESATWAELGNDFIDVATVQDGANLFTVSAPYRAHDAATVPVAITQADGAPLIHSALVIIDENPAPLAAAFTFGEAMTPLDLAFRVRVNQYSNLRVIANTASGSFMAGRFVKASGGCSAPASRDPQMALDTMGEMRLREFDQTASASGQRREAQIMIRHPNYSGLQRDQITQLFIRAHFIDTLEVYQGDDMLFRMEGGISISENPVFRFSYRDNGAATFHIRAHDTAGNLFEQSLHKASAS